jgi:8-oxo-dGTP pyrophosphatase MutT (NUDIX family)
MDVDLRPALANAVIVVDGRYALQHRDDNPAIPWPGHWGLFGGAIEPDEAADVAIVREIEEELGLTATFRLLWSTDDHRDWSGHRRQLYVFETDVTASWAQHRLGEGQGVGVFDADALPTPIAPVARDMIARHRRER